jgi:hypothetical protein
MQKNIDYIFVPKVDINEGRYVGIITKAALYFTKEYLFVLPFESLKVLLAGMETNPDKMADFVTDLNLKIPKLDIEAFHALLINHLQTERIYKIAELEKFTINIGLWIFGGLQIRRSGGPLQLFNIQPKTLREEIKLFYGI